MSSDGGGRAGDVGSGWHFGRTNSDDGPALAIDDNWRGENKGRRTEARGSGCCGRSSATARRPAGAFLVTGDTPGPSHDRHFVTRYRAPSIPRSSRVWSTCKTGRSADLPLPELGRRCGQYFPVRRPSLISSPSPISRRRRPLCATDRRSTLQIILTGCRSSARTGGRLARHG